MIVRVEWSTMSGCMYSVLDTVVISGEDVCCSVVFGTLICVFVFSVIWSELLMTSDISCPLWSSVYECQRVECAFTSPVWYVCDVMYAVLYVRVSCFVVRGYTVSRRYIEVCNCDVFSVVKVYHDHLKFCVVCINGRRYVCFSECYVVSNELDEHTPDLCDPSLRPVVKLCTLGVFALGVCFRGELHFLNGDDICMCVENKEFDLLEFVFVSVYVDLQYDEISLTFTAGSVCLCGVCSHVVVLDLPVRLSWYPVLWVRWFR